MTSRLVRWVVPLALLALSCAAPSELARRADVALAKGDAHRAFELAAKALDREPGNARARATAATAARTIAGDWERRIRAVADADTLAAAGQVLEYAAFRAHAVRYAPLAVDSAWARDERDLRHAAARIHYGRGVAALDADRPKRAGGEFLQVERFVPGYREVSRLSQRAADAATTRVAFLPPRGASSQAALARELTDAWRDGVATELRRRGTRFTRVVPAGEVERVMTVAELGHLSREQAIRIGRRLGAERVVWGTLGGVETDTRTHRFDDVIQRRVREKDGQGHDVERWVDVPVDVVARARTVRVELEYEVISTDEEVTIARQLVRRSLTARTLWTSAPPEGDPDALALCSDPARAKDPDRARRVESRWKAVAGEGTSPRDVVRGVRGMQGRPGYRRDLLPRFYPGATAPVFLDDLPPAQDLAFAALVHAWEPLADDLARLDDVDEPDLAPAPEPRE